MLEAPELPTPIDTPDLRAFEVFCSKLKLKQKRPMLLEDFQKVMLADYFAGVTETVICIPKKNAKSTTIAALGLYDLLMTHEANVIIVASAVQQADIIFQECKRMTQSTPLLASELEVRPGIKEIRSKTDNGRLKVYAAKESSLDGVEPTLGIVEEYHAHPSSELYGILRDGLDIRNGRLVCISTAGDSEVSPFGKLRAKAHGFERQKRYGKYLYCKSPDGNMVFHEWALDPSDDVTDMQVVKLANPLADQTVEKLQARYDSRQTESRWMRFACGIWTMGDDSPIKPWEWDELRGERLAPGSHVFVGVDTAFTSDDTALVPIHFEEGKRHVGTPIILTPPEGDARLDDRAIRAGLLRLAGIGFDRSAFFTELEPHNARDDIERWANEIEAADEYTVNAVVYDPSAGAEQMFQAIERDHDFRFVPFAQRPVNLARADTRFMEAVRNRQIEHDGNERLKYHVTNAVEINVPGMDTWYFGRSKRGPRKPQDALRALSMAHDAAVAEGGTEIKQTDWREEFAFI